MYINSNIQRKSMLRAESSSNQDIVQMTKCNDLIKIGRQWFSRVWVSGGSSSEARNAVIETFTDTVPAFGLSRGWQAYDPVIRNFGRKPSSYETLIGFFNTNPILYAQRLIDFLYDEEDLENLCAQLQDFCVIVYVAEVGRGYESAVDKLLTFAQNIVIGAEKDWSINRSISSPHSLFPKIQKQIIVL